MRRLVISFFLLTFALAAHAQQVTDPKLEPGKKPPAHKKIEPHSKSLQDYRDAPVQLQQK